jgi:acyl-CoA reductase-like NAD-dependent aldehyde dehydrogenase
MREGEAEAMKYQVVNPSTGQVEQDYPTATDAEIGEILDRAGRGYPAWRRTAMTERADILRRVAQLYQDRSAELGAIITREMGKTTAEAQSELEFTVGIYRPGSILRSRGRHDPEQLARPPEPRLKPRADPSTPAAQRHHRSRLYPRGQGSLAEAVA